jgi:hypothetical protein
MFAWSVGISIRGVDFVGLRIDGIEYGDHGNEMMNWNNFGEKIS